MKIFKTICLLAIVAGVFATPADCASTYTLKPAGKIGIPGRAMSFVAFSADGRMVASDGRATPGDVSRGLTFWTFPGGRFIKRVNVQPALLSPDWNYVETGDGIRRLKDNASVPSTSGSSSANDAFSADSRLVAIAPYVRAANEPGVRIVDLASGHQIGAFGSSDVFSVAMSSDGKILAAGHWDSIALWNIATGKRIGMLRGFGRYVDSIAFSRHGTLLAGGTDFGTLQIWDVRRRKRLRKIDVGGLYISQPVFNSDETLVAAGSYGTGSAWLIDVRYGKILGEAKVSDMGCNMVAISPDGRYLIAPSTGGLITWPYDQGGTIRVFRIVRR